MRIRVCVNGNLHNVHLVVVPFFDRHTAENTVKLITTLLETVCAPWQDKIISITTDGENTNTGWRNGFVARLNRMATHQLMRVWCAPHQGVIVIRAATNEMDNGAFYKTAHAFSVHLRQQQELILEMQVQFPRDTNRWMYFERILSFMLKHRRRLEQWIEEKRPVSAPSPTWWVMCASAQPLAELFNTTMTILQSHDMILCQQMAEIKSLIGHLVTAMDVEADGNPPDDLCYVRGQYWIQTQSVREHIYDQGSWARDLFNSLSAEDQLHVLHEVGQYTLQLICGWSDVQAERDERNNAGSIAPPVLPAQLVKLRTGTIAGAYTHGAASAQRKTFLCL
ncbi:hypothetical protein PsorP6_013625 [Peronosclerospora sorghi]|uniref:Uncharacterized protein n=1 Tax=Peronosclerospora sorghi TaxID=230839 RepID=A0ACC0VHL3_9STRA|nr:hypothetical protein PsorP6_013625 [Peronosclerospora sorghi]